MKKIEAVIRPHKIDEVREALTEADLTRLRRIRRLTDLGVNLAGVEIILRMRRRIEELQSEAKGLERHLASHER